jgi:hypothetical protein
MIRMVKEAAMAYFKVLTLRNWEKERKAQIGYILGPRFEI